MFISSHYIYSKLINKSVPGTVDLRALSKVQGSAAKRSEAIEDNMTLVVESGRAIGCPITNTTSENIIQKNPETITNFLVDLVRVSQIKINIDILLEQDSCGTALLFLCLLICP